MPLLPRFRHEARRRGALGDDEAVTASIAFRIVREMTYGRTAEDSADAVLRQWRGTALGKHALLATLLEELGYESAVILATHEFSVESAPWLPSHLLDEVRRAPVPDVHAFLRVRTDPVADEWSAVDATWPLAARALGLPANEAFEAGVDQRLGCDPIEFVHVPNPADFEDGVQDEEYEDAQTLFARVLEDHASGQEERRNRFLDALAAWLVECTAGA